MSSTMFQVRKSLPLILVCQLLATRLSARRWDGRPEEKDYEMSNRWLVRVRGGEQSAQRLAVLHGFHLIGPIETSKHYYEFALDEEENGRRRRSTTDAEVDLRRDPKVSIMWREPKLVRQTRQKQEPLYRRGWKSNGIAAQCRAKSGAFMNVVSVWRKNVTGRGAVVTILDDGLEWNHPDIKPNYDYNASYDFNGNDDDPSPRYRPSNRHGTRCAGVIAAAARENSTCGGPGIAFNARVGGVRMLDGLVTDGVESRALSHRRDYVDIYTVSWGPSDDGKTLDEPGTVTKKALKDGALKGRKGKGSIFVWAAGNGGHNGDSCAADGYINSIYTLAISAVDACGRAPPYTESCTSIQAVAFSSGVNGTGNITTTDLHTTCTSHHTGTSAAAPLAAGVVALGIEANSNLTWRDVQYITALTSKKIDHTHHSWHQNGAGYWVSSQYGFGLLDAYSYMMTAKHWKTVPEQHNCKITLGRVGREFSQESPLTIEINMDGCGHGQSVRHLEHVVVVISLTHPSRGDVELTLVSPSGTKSKLLPYRRKDKSTVGFLSWQFMTVHNWGENPEGVWHFIVNEKSGKCQRTAFHRLQSQYRPLRMSECRIHSLSLRFYGTAEQPFEKVSVYRDDRSEIPTAKTIVSSVSPGKSSQLELKSQPGKKLEKVGKNQATLSPSQSLMTTVKPAVENLRGKVTSSPTVGLSHDGSVLLKQETPATSNANSDRDRQETVHGNRPRFFFAPDFDFSSFLGIDEKPRRKQQDSSIAATRRS